MSCRQAVASLKESRPRRALADEAEQGLETGDAMRLFSISPASKLVFQQSSVSCKSRLMSIGGSKSTDAAHSSSALGTGDLYYGIQYTVYS